mmetsp:Transcript_32618/g.56645  ORF Transcript_32618/g.56645 Transcript_32618/m.56645 type:complete len:229 (+) Transcript_32618:2626-3312(+)
MGGFRSKPEGTLESQYVNKIENSLGFWKHSPEDVHSAFCRFIVNGTLDRKAIKRVELYLGLKNTQVLDEIVNLISPPDQRVPAEVLLVLAILLSTGSDLQKAELLWDLFERDATGEIQRNSLQGLLGSIVNAACSLAVQIVKPSEDFSDMRLNKWKDDIKVRLIKGRDGIVDSFIGDRASLKREEFFLKVARTELSFTVPSIRAKIEKVPHVAFSAGNAFARFKKPAA